MVEPRIPPTPAWTEQDVAAWHARDAEVAELIAKAERMLVRLQRLSSLRPIMPTWVDREVADLLARLDSMQERRNAIVLADAVALAGEPPSRN